MPLKKGKSSKTISKNISEFHKGATYAHTKAKFGTARANKQAVAVAMNVAGKGFSMTRRQRRHMKKMIA